MKFWMLPSSKQRKGHFAPMQDNKTEAPTDFGIFSRKGSGGITSTEIIALILSVLWVVGVVLFFSFAPQEDAGLAVGPASFVIKFLAVVLPIGMIWVGASAARSARIMRMEAARLQASIDAMRHTYVAQSHAASTGVKPSVEQKLDEIAAAQKQTETAIATFTSIRAQEGAEIAAKKPAIPTEIPDDGPDQTSFALGVPAQDSTLPITVADFIRALNFPENADDKEGFAALRRALKDRAVARLIQAAQDILTLLSQEGIYMDDLAPDQSHPETWRKFAKGARGQSIATLGGVHDRSSLALTTARMRQDPIFRDAVHHFLRQFDQTFVEFETGATDHDISALSLTRTARAFMLLGRVTGTFD